MEQEIVRLVGIDALSAEDRLTMEVARMLREDFLQQNAFSDTDSYTSLEKQMGLMNIVLHYAKVAGRLLQVALIWKKSLLFLRET